MLILTAIFLPFLQRWKIGLGPPRPVTLYLSVDPEGGRVFAELNSQFQASVPECRPWAGAHGEPSDRLHGRDVDIHPAGGEGNIYFGGHLNLKENIRCVKQSEKSYFPECWQPHARTNFVFE